MQNNNQSDTTHLTFPKSITGIQGLDVITNGGLPKNRPTLLLGNTGCGKTIMGMQFLVNGAVIFDEPGVFISFEEKTDELITNVSSLGYDLNKHIADNKLYLEYIKISQEEIQQTGRYDIEGLFVRLEQAINKINAKRLVLDSLDTLFYGFDPKVLRLEFKRLLSWLKEKEVTAIITGEIGNTFLTRHGVEEYVADCVIVLDNRSVNQVTTRRLRIAKYRGSVHGNNEYPFIIDENGITVLPLIGVSLKQESSSKRISSGLDQLDIMLDKKGFFVGSSILISGTAGTGKTSIAAAFAYNVCNMKQSCLFCAFEETPNQIIRNMKSAGLDLNPMIKSALLHFYYARPTLQNLELHFIAIKKMIKELKPSAIVLDPITNLMTEGPNSDTRSMLITFIDFLKSEQITVMFTAAITVGSIERNPSDEGISSMVDTWMLVQDIEKEATRTQTFCIMKSRGMAHSNEVKKFIISSNGIELQPILKKEN
ncbi:circadian clock protein KaiC [Flavobacterium sp.]|uniref:circadian clock protein KaiC n=1 Tax=Flavobacterium sp. TaxID=239 RepID=UPI002B4B298A|nr:circadian clock protein KaiC [Flavobacterium sp.]HLF53104.1 circadian clock protein KaiC [Flavobacterium sp.]